MGLVRTFPALLNDCKWFDRTFTGKYANLDLGSEITLPISLGIFTQPWRKELPLLLSLVPVIALTTLVAPFIGKIQLLLPACSIIWFLIYIQVRKGRILTQLGVKSSAKDERQIRINQARIFLPQYLTGTPASIAKGDIAGLVFHWVGYHDSHQRERKRAHAVTVKLKNGRQYRLAGMAYPLRILLYLAIFFGYPVTLLEASPKAERLIRFAALLAISVLTLNVVMLFVVS
ncbi:hypothetical protein [Shewanella chilikensis]|uniref:hypothetical protein n=1 Tax=Shewanella chilikensis TaxID=558541 RepID=UPI001F24B8EB|nr:hypothetical protein [Shewanella chilikensis]MCE9789783.1 hypothetical protein [Shewanella chilikensis]